MIISTKEIYHDKIKNLENSQLSTRNERAPKKKRVKNNGTMMDTGKVKCVEEHQRTNPSYFSKNKSACKWSRKIGNTKTCGDCPFGIQLLKVSPAHKTYLKNWEERLTQWKWPKENLNKISPLIKSNKIER
jgi:hypothetical protein